MKNDDKIKDNITIDYEFDRRQADYYTNAGKYLELFQNSGKQVYITPLCKKLLKMNYKERKLYFVELILKHEIFRWALNQRVITGLSLKKQDVVEQMKISNLYHVSNEDTYRRRSSTIIRWIEWMISLIQT